jgi:2-polyprenyl-3-methyl-5-hydroxy-6-metoxy-1,4-benzoquinol methylase
MADRAACPACNSTHSLVFVESPEDIEYFVQRKISAVVRRCQDCRSLFQDPWPTNDETSTFYGPHYNNYAVSKVPLLSTLHNIALKKEATRFASIYGAHAHVLDYGCGHAGFLNALQEIGGPSVAGYDFSPHRPSMLNESIPYFGTEAELVQSGLKFDVIRLNHVIEHLTDYPHAMNMLRSLLNPGGIIMGQTPNAGHYTTEIFKGRWGNFHYPYHTLLFSRGGLNALAERTGLHVLSITQTLMPTAWAMGTENVIKARLGWQNLGRTPIYTALIAATAPLAIYDRLAPWQDTNIFDFQLQLAG